MADSIHDRLDRVLRRADDLGGAWGARARGSTSLARERAVLRLLDVGGLDRSGVPLASAVVERAVGDDLRALARGIALPFVVALLEYDVSPRRLALDVASGAVDLSFEAQLLADPQRRAAAEAEARRLLTRTAARVDANRAARLDLLSVLGDARRPWVGSWLGAPMLDGALDEGADLATAGADVVRVHVPAVRELVLRRFDLGLDGSGWEPRTELEEESDEDVPAGSQRGLAGLRTRLDEVAAQEGRYIRLSTGTEALAAPEQAVVAALERVDVVEADAIAEIVGSGVDPDRALADHSFAHRLLRRAGTLVVVGPGPLIVAPDLARGIPSDTATRAGRAFALLALAVAVARGDGLGDAHLAVGALPPWLADEPFAATHGLAGVAVRRLAWPTLPLVFEEAPATGRAAARWLHLLALGLGIAGPSAMVAPHASPVEARTLEALRAAVGVGEELTAPATLTLGRPGVASAAEALLGAAEETLARLADEGWWAILGEPLGGPGRTRIGADAIAERADGPDPLAVLLDSPSA